MSTATLPPSHVRSRPIAPRPEFAGILKNEVTYGAADRDAAGREAAGDRVNSAFDRLMVQSGLDVSPPMMLALTVCAAVLGAGAAFVIQESLLTVAIGAAVGGAAPIAVAAVLRSRRQSKLLEQLPDALDELARAARTGRSLEDCLHLVATETPDPLGAELRRCTHKMTLGVDLETALRDLPRRTGLANLHVFVCALAVHNETGGDLVAMLERVARATRDRISFLGRLKAATIGSRATTVMMLVLPPAVVAFFLFRDPNYLEDLLSSFWGRTLTILAILLQVIGVIWVLRVLKTTAKG